MKIAGIQFACSKDKEKNVENGLRTIDAAISNGASIVCFQELHNLPWFPKDRNDEAFSMAEDLNGGTVNAMREKAKSAGIVVLLPIFEKDGTRFYNSCVVIDENGEIAGVYRKVHVPDIPLWEEKYYPSGYCLR